MRSKSAMAKTQTRGPDRIYEIKKGTGYFSFHSAADHAGVMCFQVRTRPPFPFAIPIDRTVVADSSTRVSSPAAIHLADFPTALTIESLHAQVNDPQVAFYAHSTMATRAPSPTNRHGPDSVKRNVRQ